MNKLLFTLCLTSVTLSLVRAEDKAPAPAAGAKAETPPAPTIELNKKSNFGATDARDPFWPIGWKKPNAKNPNAEVGPGLTAESFSLTSLTMEAGQHFAILNGKVMQEGQQFGLQMNNQIYQVTLRSIEDGRVVLLYQGGEIIVPLRRK
jgi:hypothetical protein